MNLRSTYQRDNDPKKQKLLKLILVLGALVTAISSQAAGNKPAFQAEGILSGMTKDEATDALEDENRIIRYELEKCTAPGGDHRYTCRYNACEHPGTCRFNNSIRSIAVIFSRSDRVVGFGLTLHYTHDVIDSAWQSWRNGIGQQLGEPTKAVSHPDEWTIRQTEWLFRDVRGRKLERVRLTALVGDDLFVDFEDYDAEPKNWPTTQERAAPSIRLDDSVSKKFKN
jgi:hypothetical protein